MLVLPQESQGCSLAALKPLWNYRKISTVTVTFPQWWRVFRPLLCLLQIFPMTGSNSVTLNLSLMVTGIGLKRLSESHCYLEEASCSGHFPLAAPVIEVSFTFTSCHCFSPFGLSFQLLVRRASLLIYSMARSLLPLERQLCTCMSISVWGGAKDRSDIFPVAQNKYYLKPLY